MNDTNQSNEKPSVAAAGRKARGSSNHPKGLCTCGHRASNHVAFKYGCQAAGKRKGYCPCMRFIQRGGNVGVPGTTEREHEL